MYSVVNDKFLIFQSYNCPCIRETFLRILQFHNPFDLLRDSLFIFFSLPPLQIAPYYSFNTKCDKWFVAEDLSYTHLEDFLNLGVENHTEGFQKLTLLSWQRGWNDWYRCTVSQNGSLTWNIQESICRQMGCSVVNKWIVGSCIWAIAKFCFVNWGKIKRLG